MKVDFGLSSGNFKVGEKMLGKHSRTDFEALLVGAILTPVALCSAYTSKCWNQNSKTGIVYCIAPVQGIKHVCAYIS